jgi:hypothetical protein
MSILAKLVGRAESTTTANNENMLGTVQEVFGQCEMLPVTKNLDKRATLLFKHEGTVYTVVMGKACNELFRAGKITLNQIFGFPVMQTELTDSETGELRPAYFIGVPSTGWLDASTIKVEDYKPAPVTLNDLIAAS